MTNQNGQTSPATAWEQWSDLSWHAYDGTGGWGLGVAHYVVPVISTVPNADFSPSTSTACTGGSITYTNNSTSAQTYEWSFPGGTPSTSNQTNPTVTYNTAGTYSAMLIAVSDCESDTVMLTNIVTINDLSTVSSASDVSCFGDSDGQGSVTATSSSPSFNYLWSANAGSQTTQTATGLTSGIYHVSTTDANGCVAIDTVTINQPTQLSLNSTSTPSTL